MPSLTVIPPNNVDGGKRAVGGYLKSIALRLYRAAVIVVIVWLIQHNQIRTRVEGSDPIKVEEVGAEGRDTTTLPVPGL